MAGHAGSTPGGRAAVLQLLRGSVRGPHSERGAGGESSWSNNISRAPGLRCRTSQVLVSSTLPSPSHCHLNRSKQLFLNSCDRERKKKKSSRGVRAGLREAITQQPPGRPVRTDTKPRLRPGLSRGLTSAPHPLSWGGGGPRRNAAVSRGEENPPPALSQLQTPTGVPRAGEQLCQAPPGLCWAGHCGPDLPDPPQQAVRGPCDRRERAQRG